MTITRGLFPRLAAAAILAFAVAGGGNGGYTVTTTTVTGTIVGRLAGGVSSGPEHVDCSWLETEMGQRDEIMFLDGSDVLFRPLRLVDGAGRVVAREGNTLRVTVITDGVGAPLCSAGGPLPATSVEVLP
jgi:hypothetical protein